MNAMVKDQRAGQGIVALLEHMKGEIARALPRHISPERIARVALTAIRANPQLAACSQASFLGALLQASQLGLEVNTPLGQAYLVPYKDTATLIIGYQGMMDLARRSGMVRAIYAHAVYDGDDFSWELGLEPKLKHVPKQQSRELTHVYAVARLTDGEPVFTVLTRDEVESYRKRSRASGSGPWVTDFDAMAKKTAVRRLYTWLPKSAEQARALVVDQAVERDTPQAEEFSPEVMQVLEQVPGEPVPEGTPEGRRIKLGKSAEPKQEPLPEPGSDG